MKTSRTKTISATIALVLTTTIALTLIAVPIVYAQQINYPVFAYINAAPNPVGVGQKVDILIWCDKYRTSANLYNAYRMHNYRLTITDSSGTQVFTNFWETVVDTTSAQATSWTPTAAGTYTLKFAFEGFKASDWPSNNNEINYTFVPNSATTTVTVQAEPLPPPVTSYPLPQEYWTRPIYGENTDWWSISSNWLGTGDPLISSWSSFAGYGLLREPEGAVGSQTAHIMWTKPVEFGGVVGGTAFIIPGVTYFEGSAYQQRFTNPIVVAGRLYYRDPVSFLGPNSGKTYSVDLRTGEVIWVRSDLPSFSFAYVYDVQNPNQHGTYPPILFTNNFAQAYDAYTGDSLFNVTGVPSGTAIKGVQGEILRYTFFNAGTTANPDWYLCQWNSSKLWRGASWATNTSGNSPAYDTTNVNGTFVVQANRGIRYDWNQSIPWRVELGNPSVVGAFLNDVMICRSGGLPTVTSQGSYTYFAVSLKDDATRGQILWRKTYTPPAGNITVVQGATDAESRVFTESYKETTQHVGYSMDTGERLWTTKGQAGLDYFGNPYFPYIGTKAYMGNIYSSALAGIVYCYDSKTGELKWTYGNGGEGNSTNAGFYTGQTNYPTFMNAFGNGIIYTVTTEHTVPTPIYKGAKVRAINATDGTEIYTLSGYVGEFSQMSLIIADGFTTFYNGYDDQLYTLGRGPSATTVSAPDVAASFGSPVVIKGTVTDISAGTKQNEQAARFPHGVPAVSDASMEDWMGYIYEKRPLPTTVVGVTVTLSVLDSNNNFRQIGTATTDASGFYSFEYTPEISGKYTVYASFKGTNGYWPSSAVTAFAVMAAEPEPAEPEPDQPSIADQYFLPMSIGIIAAIAIVGALLAFLLLKKKQ